MRTIYEIVEGLNELFLSAADPNHLLDEQIEQWASIMVDYRIWEECNREEN